LSECLIDEDGFHFHLPLNMNDDYNETILDPPYQVVHRHYLNPVFEKYEHKAGQAQVFSSGG